jgi:glutamine amidotransferase
MQLLFERSTEHDGAPGLGLLPGEVTYLDTHGERLPHIGWNFVTLRRASPLTASLGAGAAFYHVHSLACRPADAADVVGTAEYGEAFASIVARDNVFGVQFHPEKSSRDGLTLLSGFVGICERLPA